MHILFAIYRDYAQIFTIHSSSPYEKMKKYIFLSYNYVLEENTLLCNIIQLLNVITSIYFKAFVR